MGLWNAAGNLFRLAIVIGTLIAVSMQSSVQRGCDYALYKEDNSQGIGIWFLKSNGVCGDEMYDPEESDPFIWTARSSLSLSQLLYVLRKGCVVWGTLLLQN